MISLYKYCQVSTLSSISSNNPVKCQGAWSKSLFSCLIIHNIPCNIPNDDIMNAPYWNSINLFYIKRLLVITYNVYYGNCIEPLNDLIVKPVTTYNFRKFYNIEVLRPRTEVGSSCFQHRAALTWNLLIKNCSNLATFKRKLKDNKNFLKSISFTIASCSVSNKSLDFKYF